MEAWFDRVQGIDDAAITLLAHWLHCFWAEWLTVFQISADISVYGPRNWAGPSRQKPQNCPWLPLPPAQPHVPLDRVRALPSMPPRCSLFTLLPPPCSPPASGASPAWARRPLDLPLQLPQESGAEAPATSASHSSSRSRTADALLPPPLPPPARDCWEAYFTSGNLGFTKKKLADK